MGSGSRRRGSIFNVVDDGPDSRARPGCPSRRPQASHIAVRQRLDRQARRGLALGLHTGISGGSVAQWDVSSVGALLRCPPARWCPRSGCSCSRPMTFPCCAGIRYGIATFARPSRTVAWGRRWGRRCSASASGFLERRARRHRVRSRRTRGRSAFPEKIGYLQNGVRRDRVRGRPADSLLFRLPRDLWESSSTVPVEVEGFEGCERLFGLDVTRDEVGLA